MTQLYILVEGINIYANLFDTNQLSVIRGGSFLLKKAIIHIKDKFRNQLIPLSTGASSGLFLLKSTESATDISASIVKELNDPSNDFSLLPFIVEYCAADSLLQAKEQLLAQLRISQMKSLTVVPDIIGKHISQPDELEGRRIAGKDLEAMIQKKSRKLSYSVHRRWDQGKDLKHSYYFKEGDINESEKLKGYMFSQNFEELAKTTDYRKLNGKIAVVYMDGNGFSKIQKSLLESVSIDQQNDKQIEFDQEIQQKRAKFLHDLLLEMTSKDLDSYFSYAVQEQVPKKTIRFETLLWGGDEMLFVLPAWLGFEFIQYFFQQTKDWKIDNHSLTHAAGMVFCSAKTPIANIRDLAQSLAETVKESEYQGKTGREQNAWGYMVLESIDYPTNNDITDFNSKQYGNITSHKPALIPALSDWLSQKETLHKLINEKLLPRRQLYRIVQTINQRVDNEKMAELFWQDLKNTTKTDDLTIQEKQEVQLLQVSENTEQLMDSLKIIAEMVFSLDINQPQQRLWLWVYLYELWDYICPQTDSQKEAQ